VKELNQRDSESTIDRLVAKHDSEVARSAARTFRVGAILLALIAIGRAFLLGVAFFGGLEVTAAIWPAAQILLFTLFALLSWRWASKYSRVS
jgi:hypothetical protein